MRVGAYDIFGDFHTHTRFSHGTGSVLDNVRAARNIGLSQIAITDHGPANLFGVGVTNLGVFDAIRQEVEIAARRFPDMKVLLGVEANVIGEDGEIDVPLEYQEKFDLVSVGLHPIVRWRRWGQGIGLVGKNLIGAWTGKRRKEARHRNTTALIHAIWRNKAHVVVHPGYRLPIDTVALAKVCAKTGCVMEINARHTHTTVEYIIAAKNQGARFILGSDAHSPGRVGDLARAASLAKAAGLPPELIVNAVNTSRSKGEDDPDKEIPYRKVWARKGV